MCPAARNEASWGRVWHVPGTSEASARELPGRLAAAAGAPEPVLTAVPGAELGEIVRAPRP
ncbi:hypothetical protein ACFVFS_37135 [Kitasatospora sp. NPDC057692]|uniref:hypothetical protein n=1 Tax=Kitasatospora sp. NPDC057692 TaxID=3346215 RepID=UPI00369510C7